MRSSISEKSHSRATRGQSPGSVSRHTASSCVTCSSTGVSTGGSRRIQIVGARSARTAASGSGRKLRGRSGSGRPLTGLVARSASTMRRSSRSRGVSGRIAPWLRISLASRGSTTLVCPSMDVDGQVIEEENIDPERDARRQLALAQIRQYPDVALRMTARPVEEFDDELRSLVERMERLMTDALGIGLAATQVGIVRRLFVFPPREDEVAAVVNPEVVERSEATTR